MLQSVGQSDVTSIAHAIQLAVAPVFLMTAISSLLGVLTSRLARVVDRARLLEQQPDVRSEPVRRSLRTLAKRARLIGYAISLAIACALSVASVVIALFIDTLASVNLSVEIGGLFVIGVLLLIAALLCFLREIYLSTRYLRIGELEPERAAAIISPEAGPKR